MAAVRSDENRRNTLTSPICDFGRSSFQRYGRTVGRALPCPHAWLAITNSTAPLRHFMDIPARIERPREHSPERDCATAPGPNGHTLTACLKDKYTFHNINYNCHLIAAGRRRP